jgi:hypothetical protein
VQVSELSEYAKPAGQVLTAFDSHRWFASFSREVTPPSGWAMQASFAMEYPAGQGSWASHRFNPALYVPPDGQFVPSVGQIAGEVASLQFTASRGQRSPSSIDMQFATSVEKSILPSPFRSLAQIFLSLSTRPPAVSSKQGIEEHFGIPFTSAQLYCGPYGQDAADPKRKIVPAATVEQPADPQVLPVNASEVPLPETEMKPFSAAAVPLKVALSTVIDPISDSVQPVPLHP